MKNPPVTPSRDRYHHGDLRHALLEASLALVTEQGVERFSLREAARAVGVSPAAAYRHFADKGALLAALALDASVRLTQGMERAIARAPGEPGSRVHAVAAFAAVGVAYVEFFVQHPAHFRMAFGPWCPHMAREPGARDPYGILLDSLDALVSTGAIPAGARAGAELAAWSSVHGLASLIVEGALKLTKAERLQAIRHLAGTILTGLGCDPATLGPLGPPPPVPERCGR
jgi:AcrR family transcriptional regulator